MDSRHSQPVCWSLPYATRQSLKNLFLETTSIAPPLRQAVSDRPLWLAASTHAGEEEGLLCAHQEVKHALPGLLTIIAPRYPRRAAEIQRFCKAKGLAFALRSRGELPDPAKEIYIVDTLGELGLFYKLAEVVFVGGSFVPAGGHTLIEPAQLHCALICGPHMEHHQEIMDAFLCQKAVLQITDIASLSREVAQLLTVPSYRSALQTAAESLAASQKQSFET
ncbi:MAG: hypothetical protein LBJ70_01745, partial [Holosporales bacterium]|nr:hypothetical protein [Holosporales bacterium]